MKRHPDPGGNLALFEGDYGQDRSGTWCVRPPGQHARSIPHHVVTEHDDGTVTVIPSIKFMEDGEEIWHGRLVKGEFTEITEGGQR